MIRDFVPIVRALFPNHAVSRFVVVLLVATTFNSARNARAAGDESFSELNQRGKIAMKAGDYRHAVEAWTKALAVIDPAANNKLQLVVNLALANKKLGQYDDAERYYRMAIAGLDPGADKQARSMGIILDNLGNLYDEQGKAVEGEKLHRQALALFEKAGGPNDPDVLTCLNNVAEALIEQRKFDEALAIHQRIIAGWEKAGDPVNLAIVLDNAGRMFYRQGKFAESEPLRRRAMELFERGLGKNHPEVGICAANLAATLMSEGKLDESDLYFKRSLEIADAAYGPDNRKLIPLLRNYAALLEKLKRTEDARTLSDRADRIAKKAN